MHKKQRRKNPYLSLLPLLIAPWCLPLSKPNWKLGNAFCKDNLPGHRVENGWGALREGGKRKTLRVANSREMYHVHWWYQSHAPRGSTALYPVIKGRTLNILRLHVCMSQGAAMWLRHCLTSTDQNLIIWSKEDMENFIWTKLMIIT